MSLRILLALLLPVAATQIPGAGEITGIVVSTATSAPVPRARLTLSTAGGRAVTSLTAAVDGRFVIPNLAPGEYRIIAVQDGFVERSRGLPVTVDSGRKTDLTVGIVPDGAIAGRVVDWDGIPVVGAKVEALTLTLDSRGQRILSVVAAQETNDLGEYRLYWLPPSKYFIRAGIQTEDLSAVRSTVPQRFRAAPRMQWIPTYFPSAVDVPAADRIDLRSGATVTGTDIRLLQTRTSTVSGVVSTNGTRDYPAVVLTTRNPTFGFRKFTALVDREGSFKLQDVMPGAYDLTADSRNADGEPLFGRMVVDVGDQDIENLAISLTAGFDLRVRLTIDGRSRQSDDPQLIVNLRPAIVDTPFPTVERNGDSELTLRHIMPGDYSVEVLALTGSRNPEAGPLNGGLYMKSARFGGEDVLTSGMHIEGPTSGILEIVMADGAGSVSGVVRDDRQQTVPGVMVVLVPEPQLRSRSDLYKTATSDSSGKFAISGIVPGQYKVFSWDVVQQGEWKYRDFLELYESRGQTVRVDDRKHEPVTVQLIPPRY